MAIGRISGPLLKANLLRDGVDLAFETDLLYLDVSDPNPANHRVGIKNSSPSCTLDVLGSVCATEIRGDYLLIDDVEINGNTIRSTVGNLNIQPATPSDRIIIGAAEIPDIYGNVDIKGNIFAFNLNTENIALSGQTFVVANILIDGDANDSAIRTTNSNTNLSLDPSGTGIIILNASTQVNGNLDVSGNITAGGNITLAGNIIIGDQSITDTLSINARFSSSLIPDTDLAYTIGLPDFAWDRLFVGNLQIDSTKITTTDSNADLELAASGTGKIYVPNNDVQFDQDLIVGGNLFVNDFTATGTVTADTFTTGDIEINDNVISTTNLNSNLELRPAGIGKIYANTNLMEIAGDFTAQTIVDTVIDCGEY
jgi:cytoskeletal protein CcmA (bactofilin family)